VSPRWPAALLLIAAAVHYAWNAAAQPGFWGYDEGGHAAYALEILETGALPHPQRGWSTFHPPCYYLLAAGLWGLLEPLGPRSVLTGLRLISALGVLAAAGVVYALARRLTAAEPIALTALGVTLFVPVAQLSASMAGNEALAAGLVALALLCLVRLQDDPADARAALGAGLFAGLAFATKFSGAFAVAACAVPFLRSQLDARTRRSLAVCAAAIALIAGPVYLRNALETGSALPFTRSSQPLVREHESRWTAAPRRLGDYLRVPLDCGRYPYANVVAPGGLLAGFNPDMQSVPCLTYAGMWFDPFGVRATRTRPDDGVVWGFALLMAGIVPSLLLAFGLADVVRRVVASRGRAPEAPLLAVTALALPAYAWFTWQVPSLSAVKASYLLPLLAPAGVYFARGCALFPAPVRRVALAGSAAAAGLAAWVFATGAVFPPTNAAVSRGYWLSIGSQLPDPFIVEATQRLIE
jgi:4-amino-4-deoxy-L-arabinose transferase-like glycosyltransferase